jgi:hypothetical protein
MTESEPLPPTSYTYKPSVAGSPITFALTGEGLSCHGSFRSAVWRYEDIARIRLSYRPVSMLAHRFRADLRNKDGRRLRIVSATWMGIVTLTPQNESYRAFIEELHRRIAGRAGDAVCLAGLPRFVFFLAAGVFAALMLAMTALLVRALVSGDLIAALFLLGFGAWSAWYLGNWLTRNKPQRYAPDQVPKELLP